MAWASILYALLVFLPAYVANMGPVFVAKIIPGWKAPIDGGRMAKDGKRLLGPGKTWRGLSGGTVLGAVTAIVVALAVPGESQSGFFAGWDYGSHASPPSALWAIALFGAVMGFMALVGDAVKSYFKRRTGRDRGRPWVPFDQLDFVVFGLLGMTLAAPLLPAGWVTHRLLDSWLTLATLLVLTPLLHLLVNRIGYWLGLKEVPW